MEICQLIQKLLEREIQTDVVTPIAHFIYEKRKAD
jgi:hypothetical protein